MITVVQQNELISKIDEAINSKLADVALIFPALRENVISNMLWGIFSKDYIFSGEKSDKSHFEYVTHFSDSIVQSAFKALEKAGISDAQFFASDIAERIQGKSIDTFLDREDCDVLVEASDKGQSIKKDIEIIVAPTLPDSDIVFKDAVVGDLYDVANSWLLEYMDAYDSIKHELMQPMHKYLVQIGGHGRWIQDNYNGTYVAQFNIEIGDAGSLFLEYHNDQFHGFIDMF